jgi:hypothetical protein
VQSADRRLIQNADQLLEAVIESVRRLESKLQSAEPPAAIDLWDKVGDGRFRPKDEERLSDYLKRHLDADLGERGIIFNREVTNRRGKETDIRVQALLKDCNDGVLDVLQIVIEAKGCWNPEIWKSMETQLANRYLQNADTNHGLYVVGWYVCPKWDPDDSRCKRTPKCGKDEAERRLNAQADGLSQSQGKQIRALVLDTSLSH